MNSPQPINCDNWNVPESIIQGNQIIAQNYNTNDITYEAEGTTHYLYNKYSNSGFSEVIFPFMGPKLVHFSFNEDDYTSSNVYTPSIGGDTSVDIEVQDYFGTQKFCHKLVKVYYEVNCGFIDSPGNYVVGDTIEISNNSTGHNDKIISVQYNVDGDILVGENVQKELILYGSIPVTQTIVYFNGYENITAEYSKDIIMQNTPPELSLSVVSEPTNNASKKDYKFAHNGTDTDGFIEKVEWQIYRNNPDADGNENWSLYYTTGATTDLGNWSYNIDDVIGILKVRAIVYDNLGATAQEDYLIENDCSDVMVSFDNIDWTKKIIMIDWTPNVVENVWKQEVKKIQWDTKMIPLIWDNTPHNIQWIQVSKGIKFTYKIYTKI